MATLQTPQLQDQTQGHKPPATKELDITPQFRKHWRACTADSNLTLHGFRRFKTSHLVNLRFLEDEIAELDHRIYQAGLGLGLEVAASDRLGLKYSIRDQVPEGGAHVITREDVMKLRGLVKEYDEALFSFNQVMTMETFSQLDDFESSSLRTDLHLREIYETRLVRTDLGPRNRQDPLQRRIHKLLRYFRYWNLLRTQSSQTTQDQTPAAETHPALPPKHLTRSWSYQNTVLLAEIIARIFIAIMTGVLLIAPLAILSNQERKSIQLITVAMFIVVFSVLVTVLLRASNVEVMVVSAAYAAVLSVFVSNSSVV